MKKTIALAACAALSLAVAACGDDDDDASGDSTELTTPDVADTVADDSDASDTAATGTDASDSTGSDGTADASATEPSGTLSGDDADLAADCESFQSIFETEFENEPAVGEEITDEYREQLESFKSELEDLDLNTDLANGARDAFGDLIDDVADADTMPEGFGGDTPDELTEFGERCQALLGTGG